MYAAIVSRNSADFCGGSFAFTASDYSSFFCVDCVFPNEGNGTNTAPYGTTQGYCTGVLLALVRDRNVGIDRSLVKVCAQAYPSFSGLNYLLLSLFFPSFPFSPLSSLPTCVTAPVSTRVINGGCPEQTQLTNQRFNVSIEVLDAFENVVTGAFRSRCCGLEGREYFERGWRIHHDESGC